MLSGQGIRLASRADPHGNPSRSPWSERHSENEAGEPLFELSEYQIARAKENDLAAVAAVVEATDDHVTRLAHHYARTSGRPDYDLAEELSQVGRIAVWEALGRFKGVTFAQFVAYMDRTLRGVLADARKRETRKGVSRSVAAAFEFALRGAGGDPYEAERLACIPELMGYRTMSPEMAYAARLSWHGTESLDIIVTDDQDDEIALADIIPSNLGVPEDLAEPHDTERARRQSIRERVHATLNRLGEQQRNVLKGTYGIAPMPVHGTQNEDELAAAVGIDRSRVRSVRARGHARFEELWLRGASAGAHEDDGDMAAAA